VLNERLHNSLGFDEVHLFIVVQTSLRFRILAGGDHVQIHADGQRRRLGMNLAAGAVNDDCGRLPISH